MRCTACYRRSRWRYATLLVGGVVAAALPLNPLAAEDAPAVEFQSQAGSVAITIGGKPFATFTYQDENTSRPFFAHVRAPGGVQVTRNHPPMEGKDAPGHDWTHPGIWMSFGDINGSDYWRLAAPVKFQRFLEEPKGKPGRGGFKARYDYLDQKNPDEVVCHEDFHCQIQVAPAGYLILWDSTFSSDKELTFGDQEDMGIAFRVATPIRAERDSETGLPPGNGEIRNSEGGLNEKETWGKTAKWCDYSGELSGQRVGIALLPHPENFRPSWFHSRDYGLLVANPFGRASFGQGEKSAVKVAPGEILRLRYGVLIHSSAPCGAINMDDAYENYVQLSGDK
jgi:hypothetical protein